MSSSTRWTSSALIWAATASPSSVCAVMALKLTRELAPRDPRAHGATMRTTEAPHIDDQDGNSTSRP